MDVDSIANHDSLSIINQTVYYWHGKKRRIVQAWRVATWPEGVYSIARFELRPQQAGTRVIFDHTGFPPELRDHLAAGWEDHYWKALRTMK